MQLSKDMDEVRKLGHDIKSHLIALQGNSDDNRKQTYIDNIMKRLEGFENHYDTGNPFVDNILYVKKKKCLENNISFRALVDLKQFSNIKDEDLCTIFSNAIDNAIRECLEFNKMFSDDESLILLKAGKKRGFLFITFENSIRPQQAQYVQRCLETTKENKAEHGYGIKNIKTVLQKYEGEFSTKVGNKLFHLFIIIPLE